MGERGALDCLDHVLHFNAAIKHHQSAFVKPTAPFAFFVPSPAFQVQMNGNK